MDDHNFAGQVREILGLPKKGETVAENAANNESAIERLHECVDLATGGTLPRTTETAQPSTLTVMKDRVVSYFRERLREMQARGETLSEDGAVDIIEDGFGLDTPEALASTLAAPPEA